MYRQTLRLSQYRIIMCLVSQATFQQEQTLIVSEADVGYIFYGLQSLNFIRIREIDWKAHTVPKTI